AVFDRSAPREREAVATAVPPDPVAQSRALAAGSPDESQDVLPHDQLPAVAAEFQAETPYPAGRAGHLDWAATPADPHDMSSINYRSEVQFLVEYRAQCLWLQEWLATRSAQSLAVLQDVPRWPALRKDADHQLRKNADDAAAGDAAPIQ